MYPAVEAHFSKNFASLSDGGAFEYVSGAHYFGEIVEWTGFAMASNAKYSWAFSLYMYTASNLIPRAEAHHAQYLENFKDYPPAVIPFFW